MPPRGRADQGRQLTLPGYEPHPALVHVLTPGYMNIDPVEFEPVSPVMFALAAPEHLRKSLIDVRPSTRSNTSVDYMPAGEHRPMRIAVTAKEYNLFARHIPALAQTAVTKTLEKFEATGAKIVTTEAHNAAARAGVHAVEGKHKSMVSYLDKQLKPRIHLLEQFVEMTEHPTLARGNVLTMRDRVRELHREIFGDMLLVINHQRGWKPEEAQRASLSVDKRLFAGPNQVENFTGMVNLANEYYGHKRALVMGRLAEARTYLRNVGTL